MDQWCRKRANVDASSSQLSFIALLNRARCAHRLSKRPVELLSARCRGYSGCVLLVTRQEFVNNRIERGLGQGGKGISGHAIASAYGIVWPAHRLAHY
jgi:hypothetical protein